MTFHSNNSLACRVDGTLVTGNKSSEDAPLSNAIVACREMLANIRMLDPVPQDQLDGYLELQAKLEA